MTILDDFLTKNRGFDPPPKTGENALFFRHQKTRKIDFPMGLPRELHSGEHTFS